MKSKLIEKAIDRLNELEIQEQLELLRADVYTVIDDYVTARLEKMSEEELLELI